MKKWLLRSVSLIFLLIFFYFLFACGKKKETFKLVAVSRGDIKEKALAVGTIEPEQEIKVKSTIPGIVAEVLFKTGDRIEIGRPLFNISPNPTPMEYVEARRNVEVAQVTLTKLQTDRDRKLELFKSDMISQSDMDSVESSFQEADLRYRMAAERFEMMEKGRIRMANRNIDSIIKAPISGIVLSQSVFQGDPVVPLTNFQPGTELCSLADMNKLLFKGTVDEIDVGKIGTDMAAEIQIGALPDTPIQGKVARIFPKAKKDGNATLFDIEIQILDRGSFTLRAGYSATASILIRERKKVMLLPERLIIFENGKRFVELPQGEEAKKVEVMTGLSDGLNIEIISGLKKGEQVIERPPREIK